MGKGKIKNGHPCSKMRVSNWCSNVFSLSVIHRSWVSLTAPFPVFSAGKQIHPKRISCTERKFTKNCGPFVSHWKVGPLDVLQDFGCYRVLGGLLVDWLVGCVCVCVFWFWWFCVCLLISWCCGKSATHGVGFKLLFEPGGVGFRRLKVTWGGPKGHFAWPPGLTFVLFGGGGGVSQMYDSKSPPARALFITAILNVLRLPSTKWVAIYWQCKQHGKQRAA